MLRWNQIVRGLVARYSLPPAPRPDGTYPVPDAENPFADPQFPEPWISVYELRRHPWVRIGPDGPIERLD